LTKLILRALAVCLTLSLPSQSAASTIVDTETPSGAYPFGFSYEHVFTQYFAGKFTILDTYAITGIEGFFSNRIGTTAGAAGTVDVALHAHVNDGNIPGAILFSASTPLAAGALPDWYGVFGLNHVLAPGTYWASFTPSLTILGTMPGAVPNPMDSYAQASGGSPWLNIGADFGVGVRIEGDLVPTSVPDSGSTLSLFLAVALAGVATQRLRR
jgi:hypothetical protein